jgi:hypothetical protein
VKSETFSIILRAVEEEVMDGLLSVLAYGAVGGVTTIDTVEMLVKGYMSGAEIHE